MWENWSSWFQTRSDTKPSCTSTEDDLKLEILALGRGERVLSSNENKGADQLCSN